MVNPFEESFFRGIKSGDKLGEHALLTRALQEISKALENDKINPVDFQDIYSRDKIAADLAYVEEMRRAFEKNATPESKESKRLATIFEGIFHTGARDYGWLGENARVIKTSDFDDMHCGVDGIVEFEEPGKNTGHLAVGIDVTYSTQLAEKFRKIKDDIKNGKPPVIKYFRSGNFRGELSKIPRVIVGAERSNLIRLCSDLFIEPDKKRLTRHPFQMLQLKQVLLELSAFAEYARNLGKDDIAEVYRRDAEIIRRILQKKIITQGVRMGEWENDRVFQAIRKELENLKQT